MKTTTLSLPAIALLLAASGCTSTGRYFADRGRDLGDIVNLGFGLGGGVSAQAGIVETGLGIHRDYAGLVNGALVESTDTNRYSRNADAILYSQNVANSSPDSVLRNKDYGDLDNYLFIVPEIFERPRLAHLVYMTQFQVTAGVGPSFKVGVNPGELLDFVFGWFGLDLYDDDKSLAKSLCGTWEVEDRPDTCVILSVDKSPVATVVSSEAAAKPAANKAFAITGGKTGSWEVTGSNHLRLTADLDGQPKTWIGDASFTAPITLQDKTGNLLRLKRMEE